jgi:hypothetical protein
MDGNVLEPGDKVPGIGTVDTNHCGLPWPVTADGNYFAGVVSVIIQENHDKFQCSCCGRHDSVVLCDAISGKPLTTEQQQERINNLDFDYNRRGQDNRGRRGPLPTQELYKARYGNLTIFRRIKLMLPWIFGS